MWTIGNIDTQGMFTEWMCTHNHAQIDIQNATRSPNTTIMPPS